MLVVGGSTERTLGDDVSARDDVVRVDGIGTTKVLVPEGEVEVELSPSFVIACGTQGHAATRNGVAEAVVLFFGLEGGTRELWVARAQIRH